MVSAAFPRDIREIVMRRGLLVGKFMPLHRGHQLLIETALANVDDLTVVVYDSVPEGDYPPMPVEMRMKWITTLYPGLENVISRKDPLDVPQDDKDNPEWAPAYAKDLEFLGPFDYVFSSEEYGEPFANALGAKPFIVDVARSMLPISGTQIRENIYEHRGWVDPLVYRSLIQKVVFVGTESAGKSTIARTMAERLGTLWTHEYGRELWEAQNLGGSFADMRKIAENQYRREEAAALHANRFLFCDTNAWTTMQWSIMYHKTVDARIRELVEKTKDEYKWFLCTNDFGWIEDGVRELTGEKSLNFHKQIEHNLKVLGVNYHVIGGSIEDRVSQVMDDLGIWNRAERFNTEHAYLLDKFMEGKWRRP
jgi:NadR type nicotinamide-nucleotide adenylyltransferase